MNGERFDEYSRILLGRCRDGGIGLAAAAAAPPLDCGLPSGTRNACTAPTGDLVGYPTATTFAAALPARTALERLQLLLRHNNTAPRTPTASTHRAAPAPAHGHRVQQQLLLQAAATAASGHVPAVWRPNSGYVGPGGSCNRAQGWSANTAIAAAAPKRRLGTCQPCGAEATTLMTTIVAVITN